jgi:tetratricopeptide (TPR) repeat protein
MKRSIYIMFVCLGALVACGENSITKTLDHVENIVVQQPDSALILLDSIRYPIKSKEQLARHILFTLYAKDLSGEDISNDSTNIYVRDYLKTTKNLKYLALSEYYMGRIYQAQGKNEQAMQFYLEAKVNAENTDIIGLKGLINSYIGKLYYYQRKYDNAICNFKSALQHFNESPDNYKRQIAALNDIANCFLIKKVKDSAMICYTEALQLARTTQDSATIKQNLGVMYLTLNETGMAKQQLIQALNLNSDSDSTLLNLIYMNLSRVYERETLMDSAVYFAKLSILLGEKRNDLYSLYANYKILSRLEEKNGNYQNALNYYKKCFTSYTKIQTKNAVDIQGIETRHTLNMLKNKCRRYIIAIRLVCSAIVIITFFYIRSIYKNNRKRRKNSPK